MEVRSRKQLMQREKLLDARRDGRTKFMLECYKKHVRSWLAILCRNNEKGAVE